MPITLNLPLSERHPNLARPFPATPFVAHAVVHLTAMQAYDLLRAHRNLLPALHWQGQEHLKLRFPGHVLALGSDLPRLEGSADAVSLEGLLHRLVRVDEVLAYCTETHWRLVLVQGALQPREVQSDWLPLADLVALKTTLGVIIE